MSTQPKVPFSNAGKPVAPAKTTDGSFNVTEKNRTQETPEGGAAPNTSQNPPHLVQRPQQAGSPEDRTAPADRAQNFTRPIGDPGQASKAIGAQQAPRPFRGLK